MKHVIKPKFIIMENLTLWKSDLFGLTEIPNLLEKFMRCSQNGYIIIHEDCRNFFIVTGESWAINILTNNY